MGLEAVAQNYVGAVALVGWQEQEARSQKKHCSMVPSSEPRHYQGARALVWARRPEKTGSLGRRRPATVGSWLPGLVARRPPGPPFRSPGAGRRCLALPAALWPLPPPPLRPSLGLAVAAVLCRQCLPRAWVCRRAGQGSGRHYRAAICAELKKTLTIEEVAPPPRRAHEVRVDVHFCGVNFGDILICHGQYQERPHLPFTPGMEFSGTVLETGTDVSTGKLGDRVIGIRNLNCMVEECITDQKDLWQIPEKVSLQEAAVFRITCGTAIFALEHRAHSQPGEIVLVMAAAGATGLAVM
ncbi:PREDICTED: quinone oxidoreductase-like protein 2 [Colobus angolensis palliatus]|uniref:quinone oxidoreductase-like protein 2 n=1 Tax=Colobus angolensis palliatus TaxID=336983 RepID=UPI0005F54CE1|nr:PREDICTED: quinone oxidoreductase-like protein 2 [Colobus angolensis palliatus]